MASVAEAIWQRAFDLHAHESLIEGPCAGTSVRAIATKKNRFASKDVAVSLDSMIAKAHVVAAKVRHAIRPLSSAISR